MGRAVPGGAAGTGCRGRRRLGLVAHRCAARLVRGAPALAGVPAGRGPGAGCGAAHPARQLAGALMSVRLVDASRLAKLAPARRAELGDSPPVDRLVVCHGDACSPNTILDDTGRCCGHVDFGNLGVADRWADLAVATLSLQWNFPDYPGQVRDDEFFAAYGVAPDPARIDYYRRLWQAEDDSSR
ncbi:hypothetical protein B7493_02545 [Mycobacterium tuberculosis variant bovis]|nr:hypothetical protein B7493_02545 [Mycobacterium tuberculosis variant bovis]